MNGFMSDAYFFFDVEPGETKICPEKLTHKPYLLFFIFSVFKYSFCSGVMR